MLKWGGVCPLLAQLFKLAFWQILIICFYSLQMKLFIKRDRYSHICFPHLNLSPEFLRHHFHCKNDLSSLCNNTALVEEYTTGLNPSRIFKSISQVCGFDIQPWQKNETTFMKVRVKLMVNDRSLCYPQLQCQ